MIISGNKIRSITHPVKLEKANDNGATLIPAGLQKIAYGFNKTFNQSDVHAINIHNYEDINDILISELEINAESYSPEKLSNWGTCNGRTVDFSELHKKGSSFPEALFDHVGLTLLMTTINQVGKVSHNTCSEGFNGVALRDLDMKFKRAAPMGVIEFHCESEIFERKGQIFAESKWKFSYFDEKKGRNVVFVTFNTGSQGVPREYNDFKK